MRTRHAPALVLALVAAAVALAGPPAVTGDKQADAGKMLRVKITDLPKGAGVIWDVYPPGKTDHDEYPDGRLSLTGLPGQYQLRARVIDFERKQITTLPPHPFTLGGESPTPPGPTPPGPTPPPVPPPADPLVKVLQAAADQTPAEKNWVTGLKNIFADAATDIAAGKYPDNAALAAAVRARADAVVGAGKLAPLRAEVGRHLNGTLPAAVTPLADAPTRETFRTAYARVAAALGEIR